MAKLEKPTNVLKDGVVEIEMSGKRYELKCTPAAVFALSDQYGGAIPILRGLGNADFTMLADVIRHGANIVEMPIDDLQSLVFKNSTNLFGPAVQYVEMFLNGGKRKQVEKDDSGN
jgi:hypothetical protein